MKKPKPHRSRPKRKKTSASPARNAPKGAAARALDAELDKALEETFPASDPIAIGDAEPPANS